MLREPLDAQIRLVARGLVMLAGTDGAAEELTRLFGRDRATEALCRSATPGPASDLQDDIEIILDLTDDQSVTIDLRDTHGPATDLHAALSPPPYGYTEGVSVALLQQRSLAPSGRPYWL